MQVVKAGEYPRWPRPEGELVINHRPLGSGYVQCWAYPKDQDDARAVPPAELLAQRFPHDKGPLIAIDQPTEGLLELVLVKEGHAWAHTFSSRENLEDNLNAILDFCQKKFNIKVEGYMTTSSVGPEIEKQLDEIETNTQEAEEETPVQKTATSVWVGKDQEESQPENPSAEEEKEDTSWQIRKVSTAHLNPFPGTTSFPNSPEAATSRFKRVEPHQERTSFLQDNPRSSGSKLAMVLPVLILLGVFGVMLGNREAIYNKINKIKAVPTPTPTVALTPTPTPTPTVVPVDRKQYKLQVLNGTTKTGAAASLASKLKDLGWQVTEVGNNKTRNVARTTVSSKASFDPALKTLLTDLSGDYNATASGTLKPTEKIDAEIVIGKE